MNSHTAFEETSIQWGALRALNLFSANPDERFDRLTRLAKRLFDVPVAKVTLVAREMIYTVACTGEQKAPIPREHSFCSETIKSDDVMIVPDTLADGRFADNPFVLGAPHVRFYAGCPLVINGCRLGTLCLVDDVPRNMTQEDIMLMKDLAATVEHELTAMHWAIVDGLTGLVNRRGFEKLAQNGLNACRRMQRPASLLFFDLNGFKVINDTFGHAEGDLALRNFAGALKLTFRSTDIIGRLGGDEFAVLLLDSSPSDTGAAIQRLRTILKSQDERGRRGYQLRFSVGHVDTDGLEAADIGRMLLDGDTLMYSDKRALFRTPASTNRTS
ncbi:sensor domain-containing diguanylate cyclase [Massilia solisilvae]|uniref:Sensor domain-containing diguanylate cyclase n=1 Tax=Massilia solisilvae TaxID=1811225 RepID=A0ABT2BLH6_9BURK|nr:sensor domain-containing diguanylate cyclase [Massilia solisilvae]MCS0609356.1 sensor domain-containing diguanylate cyclase [Massilia solisilvae]